MNLAVCFGAKIVKMFYKLSRLCYNKERLFGMISDGRQTAASGRGGGKIYA